MRARARCEHCGREFLLFQLYNASPALADRCPHCSRHLGVVNVRGLAARVDRAAANLVGALAELAAHRPGFRLEPETILDPLTDAVVALSTTGSGSREGDGTHHQDDEEEHPRWPWRRPRGEAA